MENGEKMILVHPEKCTGCRLCEQVCAAHQTGQTNPHRARIQVVRFEEEGLYMPMVCQQCEEAACISVCPRDALSHGEDGAVVVDHDRCMGCRLCVAACPFGMMAFDAAERAVMKCDLCGGDPTCVQFCLAGALELSTTDMAARTIRREAAANFGDLLKKFH